MKKTLHVDKKNPLYETADDQIESITRASAKIREIKFQLVIAFKKGILNRERFDHLFNEYDACGKALKELELALKNQRTILEHSTAKQEPLKPSL